MPFAHVEKCGANSSGQIGTFAEKKTSICLKNTTHAPNYLNWGNLV